jgi:transcriptional regulator with XRE-family HTH domain
MKRINYTTEADIGARVRAARLVAGLSQEALADHLGITFQQVQKYEKGTNRVSVSRLVEIAAFTGQPIVYFLPGTSESGDIIGFDRDDVLLVKRFAHLSPQTKRALLTFADELDRAA